MSFGIDTDMYIRELNEIAIDSGDNLTFNLYGDTVQDLSDGYYDPVVRVNNVVVTEGVDYTFDYANGTITFALAVTDTVNCDYVWKKATADFDDMTEYSLSRPLNVETEVDVNGIAKVTENINRRQTYIGTFSWGYVDPSQLNFILHLVETAGLMFDVYRIAHTAYNPYKSLTRLMVITSPTVSEIGGVPEKYMVTIGVRQLYGDNIS